MSQDSRNLNVTEEFIEKGIKPVLRLFLKKEFQPASADVLKFWERSKNIWCELYPLAMIVLAAPATQVSVERLFSSMRFIFSTLRGNLKNDILDAILVVRSNYEIIHNLRTLSNSRKKTKKILSRALQTTSTSTSDTNSEFV